MDEIIYDAQCLVATAFGEVEGLSVESRLEALLMVAENMKASLEAAGHWPLAPANDASDVQYA